MQLQELISTLLLPHHRILKWRIADDDGKPITTLQGQGKGYRYFEHADETAMLRKLKPLFRDYEVISMPDVHRLTHCLYEARQHVPIEAAPDELASETRPLPVATTGELF